MNYLGKNAQPSDDGSEDTDAELFALQRRYRVMQNDTKAYTEETSKLIAKQNNLISVLNDEDKELNTILNTMTATHNQEMDRSNSEKLRSFTEQEQFYKQQIANQRQELSDYDKEIAELERKISEKRKNNGGDYTSSEKYASTKKRAGVMENRLYKATVYFNKQLEQNRNLRDEIDHLRLERNVFNSLYDKLRRQLESTKKLMNETIEQTTSAYEQRDESYNKIVALKELSDKCQTKHNSEMKDLLRTIGNDDKLKEFMAIKNSERLEVKAEEALKKKRAGMDGSRSMDIDRNALLAYEESFRQITAVNNEESIETVIDNFLKTEGENFALFNYVNELNNETEVIAEKVAALHKEMEKFQAEDIKANHVCKGFMKELECEHAAISQARDTSENRLKSVSKVLHQLREGVTQIFKAIGCDPQPIHNLLGMREGMTNKNVMLFMGIIEQRTNELLRWWNFENSKSAVLKGVQPPSVKGGQSPQQPTAIKAQEVHAVEINPPSTEINSDSEADEDDTLNRPLTVAELREKAARNINKRTDHCDKKKRGK